MKFNLNVNKTFVDLIFFNIDFKRTGTYKRKVFLSYHNYREDYYEHMSNGYTVHNLSNYLGIIIIWYYKSK